MQNEILSLNSLPDETLVEQAQSGNKPAFEELLRRHQLNCLKLAASVLRDPCGAEDEVQTAFWKGWLHIGQFHRDAKFSTWLTRIVVNQCLMRLRQTKRARLFHMDDIIIGEEQGSFDLPSPQKGPEHELGRRQVATLIRKELNRIPPLLRHVFLLRDINELPMPDVAAKLGISVAAAKSRLLRARLELRERMGKHMGRMGAATLTA